MGYMINGYLHVDFTTRVPLLLVTPNPYDGKLQNVQQGQTVLGVLGFGESILGLCGPFEAVQRLQMVFDCSAWFVVVDAAWMVGSSVQVGEIKIKTLVSYSVA